MKASVYDLNGKPIGSVILPAVFSTPFRPDVIHRVYTAIRTHMLQPQGRDPLAGEKTSAETYNPPTGRGISRLPRVKGERFRRAGQVAGVASVVKGRVPHPPRAEKKIHKLVNRKERRLALASAIAATTNRELVSLRGHIIDKVPSLPLIVSDEIQSVMKARELRPIFKSLGVEEDVLRAANGRKRRSGTAKHRGRVTKIRRGPLLVIARDKGVKKAVQSFPGVDCIAASDINILEVAPGSKAGRLVIWSKSALKKLPKPLLKAGERYAA